MLCAVFTWGSVLRKTPVSSQCTGSKHASPQTVRSNPLPMFPTGKMPGPGFMISGYLWLPGRRAIFEEAFRENPWMLARARRIEEEKAADAYSEDHLKLRKPDFIAINSLYYRSIFIRKKQPAISFYSGIFSKPSERAIWV